MVSHRETLNGQPFTFHLSLFKVLCTSLLAILGHGLPLGGIKSSDALALPTN